MRLIHRLGVDEHGKPNVADLACKERSRVMRLAGTVNYKTGQHARIVEADFRLPAYRIDELVGDLPDPGRTPAPPRALRAGRQGTRTSGSRRPSTSPGSPGSTCHAADWCPVRRPGTRTATRRAASASTPARAGAVTPGRAARVARSTTSRRCSTAGRGGASCEATRSHAPRARTRGVRRAGMTTAHAHARSRVVAADSADAVSGAGARQRRRAARRPREPRLHQPATVARRRARARALVLGGAVVPADGRQRWTGTVAIAGGRRTVTLERADRAA